MTIKAVVFDFYFTLVDPTVHAHATVAELLAAHGSQLAAEEVLGAWFQAGRAGGVERPLDGEIPPFTSFREHWAEAGGAHLAGFGLPADHNGWARSRRDAHIRAVLYDEVPAALEELRGRGLRIGVMSDADDDFLLPCIEATGLSFDAVVSSEGQRCYKPHRSMFTTVCELLGVATNEAVYVGDTPRADIVGARNAGMATAWINRNRRTWPAELEPADFTITSLSDLLRVLDGTRPKPAESRND